jgi:hypothetical protein
MQDKDGDYIRKNKPMYPVSFDAVRVPGYSNCRLCDPDTFASNNQFWLSNGKPETLENGTEDYLNISQNWFVENPLEEKKALETIGSESLLMDLSECLNVKLQSRSKPKKIKPYPMYENTRIFHELMKTKF